MKRPFFLVLLPLLCLPLFAQNADLRGLKTVVRQLEGETAVVGKQYAVLIAIDKYKNWMALRNPVKDAKEIKEILSRKYFMTDFIELYDETATKSGIIKLFNKLINETKPEDSVLIFYAGHGHLDITSNTGFWIPIDGGTDVDEQSNWLPNAQIRGFISNMKARHVALIADSCFSGDFLNPTRGMAPTISNQYFKNAYARISRQVLTSGASESVPDESSFTRQLKLALEGNTAPYLDPLMLYNQIRLGVTQTTPLFGNLKDSGHQEGSSFLLFLRERANQAVTEEAASSEQPQKTSFKIEKGNGKASVRTETAGTLFLDGVLQGQVPEGRVATIENLAFGNHELEMRYENGETEKRPVTVDSEKAVSITFSRIFEGSASQLKTASEEQAPPTVAVPEKAKEELSDHDPLPNASIKINGNFEDWKHVLPALSQPSASKGNLNIDKVSLVVDSEKFYMKFDIRDDTPSTFFHPNNFDTRHNSYYAIYIEYGTNMVILAVFFDTRGNRWDTNFNRKVNGKWEATNGTGAYAMKGSSLEAAFPLELIRKSIGFLAPGTYCSIAAFTQYSDSQNKKVEGAGDYTKAKLFTF